MNTIQPRRSARIAGRSANPTVTISIPPSVPVKTSTGKTSQETVKIRHSARSALRSRPNYYEAEEWEVEDPIYTSNTDFRSYRNLPEDECANAQMMVGHVKKALDKATDYSLPSAERHRAVIDILHWSRMSGVLIPMYPTYRATVRTKVREFVKDINLGYRKNMTAYNYRKMLEEIALIKEALTNAHRSPWYVAAGV